MRGRVVGDSTPGLLSEAWSPETDARRSRSKGSQQPVRPHVSAEEVILVYTRVQGGFEGTSVGKEAAKEKRDVLNKRRKVSTASPAPSSM